MSKLLLIIFLCFSFLSFTFNNNSECNYIESGYYQLIYEADTAYLSGNKSLAYEKIRQAESSCPLIEQMGYYEISKYVELLIENEKYEDAVSYIICLVKEYGYSVESIEQKDYFHQLKNNINWNELKANLDQFYKNFYEKANRDLVKELNTMHYIDQEVRKEWSKKRRDKEYIQKMNETDSIHEIRMKEIFEEYGYPNTKLLGQKYAMTLRHVRTMLMHFSDTAYFVPVLFDFIKKGECPPDVLGSFVDSRARMDTAKLKFIYGIYANAYDEIKDVNNLDNRRKEIGMSSIKIQQLKDSIAHERFKSLGLTENNE